MKKFVYICAPYRAANIDGVKENIDKAIKYARKIMVQGHIPMISHIFTDALWGKDTDHPHIDKEIVDFDLELLSRCDEMAVCGERISHGMQREIEWCKENKKPFYNI